MITWINESKTLTKHISCECKCKFDGDITINFDVSAKNIIYVKKIIFGILLHVQGVSQKIKTDDVFSKLGN